MNKFKVLLISALAMSAISAAQSEDFPDTVDFTIPFSVGGGTDVWARFIAPNLSKHLPNESTVVIKNQPGGGSITGANLFAKRAKNDGTDIIGTSASTLYPYMLEDRRVQFDLDEWRPLLASPTGGVIYIQPDLGISGPEDANAVVGKELVFASQGPTQLELPVLIALDLLGADVKAVFGMKGRGDGRLAFERGEATIDFQTTSAYLSSVTGLVDNGKAVPLFSLGVMNADGDIVRDKAFEEIPTFEEVYEKAHGKKPSGMQYDTYRKFLAAGFAFQKLIFIPKDASEETIQTYLDTVNKMLADPEFSKQAIDQIGPYKNVSGTEIEDHLKKAVTIEPDMLAWLTDWMKEEFNFKL